jgi:gamma-glutamylcyclotransferase (GGCT)/AIG2-like uncharacterized protein YtfP
LIVPEPEGTDPAWGEDPVGSDLDPAESSSSKWAAVIKHPLVASAAAAIIAGLVLALVTPLFDVASSGADTDTPATSESVPASTPASPTSVPTPAGTYFFVYGTTMPGHLRYHLIQEFVAEATPARVPGQVYDTGSGYPAAKFGPGTGEVEGHLLRLRPERVGETQRLFTQIEAGMFERVSVETNSGVTAFAYEWIGSIQGMELIAGEWSGEES